MTVFIAIVDGSQGLYLIAQGFLSRRLVKERLWKLLGINLFVFSFIANQRGKVQVTSAPVPAGGFSSSARHGLTSAAKTPSPAFRTSGVVLLSCFVWLSWSAIHANQNFVAWFLYSVNMHLRFVLIKKLTLLKLFEWVSFKECESHCSGFEEILFKTRRPIALKIQSRHHKMQNFVNFLIKKTNTFAFEVLRGSVKRPGYPCDVILTCEKIPNANLP